MQPADNVTRALLAAILVCLAILVGRAQSGEAPAEPEASAVRFEVRPVAMKRGAPLLLRTDTATGEAWSMGAMDAGRWDALREGSAGIPSPGASAPGRYSIRAVVQRRGSPTLVRSDHATGRVWRKGSTNAGPWVLVPNPESPAAPAAAVPQAPETDLEADSDTAEPAEATTP